MSNKKKEVTRENTIQIRVNDEEYNIIEHKANQIGLTTSNYIRMVSLNAKIEVSIKSQVINNISKKNT